MKICICSILLILLLFASDINCYEECGDGTSCRVLCCKISTGIYRCCGYNRYCCVNGEYCCGDNYDSSKNFLNDYHHLKEESQKAEKMDSEKIILLE